MEKLDTLSFTDYKDQLFKRLEAVVSYESLSAKEQAQYDEDMKWAMDYNETALYQFDKGLEKGRAEGRAEGLEKGRAEGRAEGVEQGKWEDAMNFFKLGVDIETIAKATGLPLEELKARLKI